MRVKITMPSVQSLEIRDRILRRWVLEGHRPDAQGYVLHTDEGGAVSLYLEPSRNVIVLLPLEDIPSWNSIRQLETRLSHLLAPADGMFLKSFPAPVFFVLLLGGDERVRTWVSQLEFEHIHRAYLSIHHFNPQEQELWSEVLVPPSMAGLLKDALFPDASSSVSFRHLEPSPLRRNSGYSTILKRQATGENDSDLEANDLPLEHSDDEPESRPIAKGTLDALALRALPSRIESRGWAQLTSCRPLLSYTYLTISLLLFALAWWTSEAWSPSQATLTLLGAGMGSLILEGDVWRTFTQPFLFTHGWDVFPGFVLTIWCIAPLENYLGRNAFLSFFGLATSLGTLSCLLLAPDTGTVGAASLLPGVILATRLGFLRGRQELPVFAQGSLPARFKVCLFLDAIWLLFVPEQLSALPGTLIGGALASLLFDEAVLMDRVRWHGVHWAPRQGRLLDRTAGWNSRKRSRRYLALILSILTFTGTLGSLASGLWLTRPWELGNPPMMSGFLPATHSVFVQIPTRLLDRQNLSLDRPRVLTLGTLGRDGLQISLYHAPLEGTDLLLDEHQLLKRYASLFQLMAPEIKSDAQGYYLFTSRHAPGSGTAITVARRQNTRLVIAVVILIPGMPPSWEMAITAGLTRTKAVTPTPSAPASGHGRHTEGLTNVLKAYELPDYPATVRELTYYLTARPGDSEAMNLLAETLIRLERYSEAEEVLQRWLAQQPDSIDARQQLVELKWRQAQLEAADQSLSDALELAPQSDVLRLLKGRLLLEREHYDEALGVLEQLISEQPGSEEASILLAKVCLLRGQQERGVRLLEQLLRGHPGPDTDNNVSYTLFEAKARPDWALELAQRAVSTVQSLPQTVPDDRESRRRELTRTAVLAMYWDTLGSVHLARMELDSAGTYLLASYALSESGATAYHLGQWLERRGEKDAAQRFYARSVAALEPHPQALERLRLLSGQPQASGPLDAIKREGGFLQTSIRDIPPGDYEVMITLEARSDLSSDMISSAPGWIGELPTLPPNLRLAIPSWVGLIDSEALPAPARAKVTESLLATRIPAVLPSGAAVSVRALLHCEDLPRTDRLPEDGLQACRLELLRSSLAQQLP